jgi:hypothetical protein
MDTPGYKKITVRPDFKKVTVISSLAAIAIIVLGILIQLLVWKDTSFSIDFVLIIIFLAAYIAGLMLHELIHALAMRMISGVSFSNIQFGFNKRYLSPYTYCNKIVPVRGFRIGLLLPVLITGVLPMIIGIATNTLVITLIGGLLTASGVGDIIGFCHLVKLPGDALLYDYRYALGCEVYVRETG